jgi:hypothetical protein
VGNPPKSPGNGKSSEEINAIVGNNRKISIRNKYAALNGQSKPPGRGGTCKGFAVVPVRYEVALNVRPGHQGLWHLISSIQATEKEAGSAA